MFIVLIFAIHDSDFKMNTEGKNRLRKMVSFKVNSVDSALVQKDIDDGWFIVHLSSKGKFFIGILEKNFINYDADNVPVLYIPPRKNLNWSV